MEKRNMLCRVPVDARCVHRFAEASRALVLHGQKTGPVGEGIISAARVGVASLVQELNVARVDGEGLVVGGPEELTVADIVGPTSTRVGLASEGVGLGSSIRSPLAIKAVGSEGPEVPAVAALGLNDHEVLVLACKSVDLDSLEKVLSSVAHDLHCGGEVAGEISDGHLGAVDLAVVAGEEKVHVLAVTDDSLIDRAGAAARDGAHVHRLRAAPAVDVGGILRGAVGEGSGSPLVGKNPSLLGSKVEEGGSDGAANGHLVLLSRCQLVEVADGREAHGAVVLAIVGRCVHELLAVVGSNGEILKGNPSEMLVSVDQEVFHASVAYPFLGSVRGPLDDHL